MAQKYNAKLQSPGDRKIQRSVLMNAVKRGEVGVSPKKKGRPPTVPAELTMGIATHAAMMQVSGEAEASGQKMKATISALAMGTDWENKVNSEYVWRKTRSLHPDILNPVQAKDHEDRRADWLTYANINEWTDVAKKYLIELGMLFDEPGEICKCFFCIIHYHYLLAKTSSQHPLIFYSTFSFQAVCSLKYRLSIQTTLIGSSPSTKPIIDIRQKATREDKPIYAIRALRSLDPVTEL